MRALRRIREVDNLSDFTFHEYGNLLMKPTIRLQKQQWFHIIIGNSILLTGFEFKPVELDDAEVLGFIDDSFSSKFNADSADKYYFTADYSFWVP